jgi:cytochrome c oxidase subunit 3
VDDVSSLPTELYGSANITWGGALLGEVIEGFVLVIAIFTFFYLRRNATSWPPLHTPLPSLGPSTLNLGLMALSVPAAWLASRAAQDQDRWSTFQWLVVHAAVGTAIMVVRYFELRSLNVRWDTNAYGSITWALLFSHGYIGLFDVFDTMGLAILCLFMQPEEKHFIDVTENSFFWYFVVATWIPVYLLVFIGPRFG